MGAAGRRRSSPKPYTPYQASGTLCNWDPLVLPVLGDDILNFIYFIYFYGVNIL